MYNTCYDCRAKILIYPDDIHPDIITQSLGLVPTTKGVKNEYREGYKGRKYIIKNSTWFLISEEYVESEDLQDHIAWIVNKINKLENLPVYLQKRLEEITPHEKKNIELNEIFIDFSCVWNPVQDHGGPILSPEIMNTIAQLNVQFSLESYFTYDISTVACFMEAGQLLEIGQNLNFQDWMKVLVFIKSLYNIPPSMLGSVYDNGDYRDDEGKQICNIKDYVL